MFSRDAKYFYSQTIWYSFTLLLIDCFIIQQNYYKSNEKKSNGAYFILCIEGYLTFLIIIFPIKE